ncbi:MAG: GerMN domain-containing protein [Thermodesulfobacteriota bacterium]
MAKKKRKKKKGKGPRVGNLVVIAVVALATAALGAALLIWLGERPPGTPRPTGIRSVRVYFGSPEGTYLTPETRGIRRGDLAAEVTEAVGELLRGPKTGLTATIPVGTKVLAVKVRGGTAFVDLSGEVAANHPGGSSGEIQTVYSIVNTVTVNFTSVKNVQILIDGKKRKTLAGHIDISLPLGANTRFIRTRKTLESRLSPEKKRA